MKLHGMAQDNEGKKALQKRKVWVDDDEVAGKIALSGWGLDAAFLGIILPEDAHSPITFLHHCPVLHDLHRGEHHP